MIPVLKIGLWASALLVGGIATATIIHYAGKVYKKVTAYITRKNLPEIIEENLRTGAYTECDIGLTQAEVCEINEDHGMSYVDIEIVDEFDGVDELHLCTSDGTSLNEGEIVSLQEM